MHIAIISTVYKSTPPNGYGGIERVVHTFVEQLIKDGHSVTLFATPGSYCKGKTIIINQYDSNNAPAGIHSKSDKISEEPLYETVKKHLKDHPVDIIHDWSFDNLFVLRHQKEFPFVISICIPPFKGYMRPNLVACSNAHAKLCGGNTKFVHYGLDLDNWKYQYEKKEHFIHISKIVRYKGQHIAALAAKKADVPLLIAGNIEDIPYYYFFLKPLLFICPTVTTIGEISGTKNHLPYAKALIQTPKWFDAFPLVILESFASGTPVIALDQGGVSEQIENGVNGFLCKNIADITKAMKNIHKIKPKMCRQYAEEKFSVKRMVKDYVLLYEKAIDGDTW